jgi:TatD DNase family protein
VVGAGYGMRGARRSVEVCCSKEIQNSKFEIRNKQGKFKIQNSKPELFCTLGVHPHEAKDMTEEDFTEIKQLISGSEIQNSKFKIQNEEESQVQSKIVAIGEIGLDYHYFHSPKDVQRAVFSRFLELAVELKKPVMIHDRETGTECVDLIQQEGRGALVGQAHCFSGDWALAQKYLDLGFYISVTGVITFPKANQLRDVVQKIPLDRLLVETDAPFLAPVPFRGKKNQPAYVRFVVEELAKLRGISFEEMARITFENAARLFGLTI